MWLLTKATLIYSLHFFSMGSLLLSTQPFLVFMMFTFVSISQPSSINQDTY